MNRPIGYVVTRYPTVSHTFILREVMALRRAGTEVVTYSVHQSASSDALSAEDRAEADSTTALRPVAPVTAAVSLLRLFLLHPGPFLAALLVGVRRGAGLRGRLWQVFYFAEAVLLRGYCRRDGVRHLHAHFANNGADVARATAELGNRIEGAGAWSWSFSMHGPTEFEQPHAFGLAGKARDALFIACISHYCQRRIDELVAGGEHGELVLVRCGLDLARFPPVVRDRPDDTLRVLCVGRLVPEKGQDLLVRAVGELVTTGIPVELVLVGDGPARGLVEAEVQALGLEGVVTLTGAVGQDQIGDWYAWADVFALISNAEGLPVVLMEAMATGLPVVTTRIAGIPELVEDGLSGALVEPGDVSAAAEALRAVAADREWARRAGTCARERVVTQHDVDRCILPLRDAFEQRARR